MPQSSVDAVFHYTTGINLDRILSDGFIKPAVAGGPRDETPVAWFSANKKYEPTAAKMFLSFDGTARSATIREMDEHFGVYRLAARSGLFTRWPQLIKLARIKSGEARRLERLGRKLGALPSDWYGCVEPVVLADIVSIERWVTGCWLHHVVKTTTASNEDGARELDAA